MIVVFDLINNSGLPFSKIIPNCGLRIIFLLLLNIMLLGGISTAHMRFIAIRYTQIMVQWGEVEIMSSILMLWHTILIGNTYLMVISSADEYKNRCYTKEKWSISYLPGPIFLFACGMEFSIYTSICHYVYKSDIKVRQFISSLSYVKRQHRNALNMFEHTIHILIKLWWYVEQ